VSEVVVGYGTVERADAFEEGMEVCRWGVWPGVVGEYESEEVLFGLCVIVVVVVGDELEVKGVLGQLLPAVV
jgi:hypothetical protein